MATRMKVKVFQIGAGDKEVKDGMSAGDLLEKQMNEWFAKMDEGTIEWEMTEMYQTEAMASLDASEYGAHAHSLTVTVLYTEHTPDE